jgi:hypothetical protein
MSLNICLSQQQQHVNINKSHKSRHVAHALRNRLSQRQRQHAQHRRNRAGNSSRMSSLTLHEANRLGFDLPEAEYLGL